MLDDDPVFEEEFNRVISEEDVLDVDDVDLGYTDPYMDMELAIMRDGGEDAQHAMVKRRAVEKDGKPVLEFHLLLAALGQLEVATVQISKIYIGSLEFLWLFMMHYYPKLADNYLNKTVLKCMEDTVGRVRALGLNSKGLTYI